MFWMLSDVKFDVNDIFNVIASMIFYLSIYSE